MPMSERGLPGTGPGNQVSRNDPCPCGSGKKYKRCCLPKEVRRDLTSIERDLEAGLVRPDRFDDPELDAWKQADRSIGRKICEAALEAYPDPDAAIGKYWSEGLFRKIQAISLQQEALDELFHWLALDYRPEPGAKTVAETMMERPIGLTEKERRVLAGMAGAARSIWQVVRIEKDKGVEAEDLLRGGRVFITDISLSRTACPWVICPFRVYPAGPFQFIVSGWTSIPPAHKSPVVGFFKRRLATYRRKRPGASWDEFLRARADLFPRLVEELGLFEEPRMPRLTNMDGEELIACRAEFFAEDLDAALAALDGKAGFEVWEDRGKRGATLRGKTAKPGLMGDGKPIEASVSVDDDKLVLQCNSRKRLAKAKKTMLSLPGVRLVKETFQTVEDLMAERPFPHSPPETEPSPQELKEVARKFQEQYYEERWVKDRIPALDGKTPLEMVKTPEGRERVRDLIRHMEYLAATHQAASEKYDFNRLRGVLGLEAE
jgi:hypothetical protein